MTQQHTDPALASPRSAQARAWSAGSVLVLGLAALAIGAGLSMRFVDCSVCHTMRSYSDAHAQTRHASLDCIECHMTSGLLGLPADGVRAVHWLAAEPFTDRVSPAPLGDRKCRRCHEEILAKTVVASVRVRHSDFVETPCGMCHGGSAHPLEGRRHIGPQMDDCLACHRASPNNIGTCDVCHPVGTIRQAREGATAWRATHGSGWEQSHGMGDLAGCPACHAPSTCKRCHGVGLPHPPTWGREHGTDLAGEVREACATCHEPAWCTGCHGVEMPHPVGFLPVHGPQATDAGQAVCERCHEIDQCKACHYFSRHPNPPVVGMSKFGRGEFGGGRDGR